MSILKIIVIGCDAFYPRARGACSGYLLEADGKRILIDCGSAVISNLQRCCNPEDLDCVFISHLHEDHKADLHTLRYALDAKRRNGSLSKKIDIYLPGSPESEYAVVTNKMEGSFNVHELKPAGIINIGNLEISFINTAHPILTLAMKFKLNKKSLVYTGDSAPHGDLLDFCQSVDVIIGDATYSSHDAPNNSRYHMTAQQLSLLGRNAEARLTVLSHLNPENDRKDYEKELSSSERTKVAIAEMGMCIQIDEQGKITISRHLGFVR